MLTAMISINDMRLTLMVHQVAQTLREAHCGHRNRQPLVYCNDDEEEEMDVVDARYGLMMSNMLHAL